MIRRLAAAVFAVLLLSMQGKQAAGVVPCPLHQAAHAGDRDSGLGHREHQTTPDHGPSCTCVGACQAPATPATGATSHLVVALPPVAYSAPQLPQAAEPRPSFPHQLPYSTAPPATC